MNPLPSIDVTRRPAATGSASRSPAPGSVPLGWPVWLLAATGLLLSVHLTLRLPLLWQPLPRVPAVGSVADTSPAPDVTDDGLQYSDPAGAAEWISRQEIALRRQGWEVRVEPARELSDSGLPDPFTMLSFRLELAAPATARAGIFDNLLVWLEHLPDSEPVSVQSLQLNGDAHGLGLARIELRWICGTPHAPLAAR